MADEKFTQEVTRWLEQSGYPLEMLVAREFRRASFPTWQSTVYEDATSGTEREIDVVATRAVHLEKWTVRLQFVVECKRSPDAPWVVFAGEEGSRAVRPNLFFTVANREGELLRPAFGADERVRGLPLFTAFERSGYGMVQAFRKPDKDVCYTAVMQALGAALSLVHVTGISKLAPPSEKRNITFIVPVVVVDGRLVEATLVADGEVTKAREMTEHCLCVQRPGVNAGGTMIFVITKPALPEFVRIAGATADGLFDWSKDNQVRFGQWSEQLANLRASPVIPPPRQG